MTASVGVVGAGSWGTTVASMLATRADTVLWAREAEVVAGLNLRHRNELFLPDLKVPDALRASTDLGEVIAERTHVFMAVPVQYLRSVADRCRPFLSSDAIVVNLAKGIERQTLCSPTQILMGALSLESDVLGVLSGPNLAREVLTGQPSASVIAFDRQQIATEVQALLTGEHFRVYTSTDVIGCQIGGAVKNVIAIAAGIATGLGFGWNSRSALITRGLAELTRLGVSLGGDPLTFLGLAGNGDLIATCSSEHSRNRRVGVELGKGRLLSDILADTAMVAEGVATAPAVVELAQRHGVEMPVAEVIDRVLRGDCSPEEVVHSLMARAPTSELHDFPHG
jgi:glycerol-3-phosphate dehydrogenase (NAD(P)+)